MTEVPKTKKIFNQFFWIIMSYIRVQTTIEERIGILGNRNRKRKIQILVCLL